jgi:hypothetical protein
VRQVERTREHADQLVQEKELVASRLDNEYRLYVQQARSELRQHMEQSRAAAETRKKKERAVRRNIADAQIFAMLQDDPSRPPARGEGGSSEKTDADAREERERQELDMAIDKAQVRMQMQQRRLKSARLEMIECLREQQTIQVCLSER